MEIVVSSRRAEKCTGTDDTTPTCASFLRTLRRVKRKEVGYKESLMYELAPRRLILEI